MQNKELHEALAGFPLAETGGEVTFLRRLCRENQWTAEFGLRTIDEYKRFVYLAMVSPAPVTPSREVDQVWHLHLLYTRSYWEDLRAILGRPLHHGPTAGGQQEDEKFHGWYERTKLLYESEFRQKPPADLWPPAEVRFDPRQRFRRLDVSAHWIIAKPKPWWWHRMAAFAAPPLSLPHLAASGDFAIYTLFGILLAILIVFVILTALGSSRRRRKRDSSDEDGDGCTGFLFSCGSGGSDDGDCGGGSGDGGGCGGGGCGGGGCGS